MEREYSQESTCSELVLDFTLSLHAMRISDANNRRQGSKVGRLAMAVEAIVRLDCGSGKRGTSEEVAQAFPQSRQSRLRNFTMDHGIDEAPGARRHFSLEVDFNIANKKPVRQWVNEAAQSVGFRPDRSLPFRGYRFSEPPQIRYDRKGRRGAIPDADPITLGIWLISDRLKRLFERVDSAAFGFQRVVVDYSNFPEPGPDRWFCYITRVLDCVDEEHSVVRYQDHLTGIRAYAALIDVRMKPEVVGMAHAFRLKYADSKLIVDDVMVDAMSANDISGFEYQPIQK
ncbi:imm11 family protein [Bradyrhizobium sp. 2TAF24]|uniref:imm11 family protein n=1 Tax=Bradyrhizobium sp. 2TAF24 TaxID=3233011 RepID=UPI003F8EAB57